MKPTRQARPKTVKAIINGSVILLDILLVLVTCRVQILPALILIVGGFVAAATNPAVKIKENSPLNPLVLALLAFTTLLSVMASMLDVYGGVQGLVMPSLFACSYGLGCLAAAFKSGV